MLVLYRKLLPQGAVEALRAFVVLVFAIAVYLGFLLLVGFIFYSWWMPPGLPWSPPGAGTPPGP